MSQNKKLERINRCPAVLPADENGYYRCCNEPRYEKSVYCKMHYEEYIEKMQGVLGPFI